MLNIVWKRYSRYFIQITVGSVVQLSVSSFTNCKKFIFLQKICIGLCGFKYFSGSILIKVEWL